MATPYADCSAQKCPGVVGTHRGTHLGKEEVTPKLSRRDGIGVTQAEEVGRALQEERASSKERPAPSVPEPLAF